MVGAGLVFIFTRNPIALAIAAIIGVISPSGNEIGPFLSVEQAALDSFAARMKNAPRLLPGMHWPARWPRRPGRSRVDGWRKVCNRMGILLSMLIGSCWPDMRWVD